MIVTLLSHPSLLSLDSGANDLEISDFSSDAQTRRGHHFMLLPGTAAGALRHIMAPGCVPLFRLSLYVQPKRSSTSDCRKLHGHYWVFFVCFVLLLIKHKEKCIMLKKHQINMEEKDLYCTKKRHFADVVKPHENMPIVTLNLK